MSRIPKLKLNRETLRILNLPTEANGGTLITVNLATMVCTVACLPQLTTNCGPTWGCNTGPICFKSIRPGD